jgi:hypothetical protein
MFIDCIKRLVGHTRYVKKSREEQRKEIKKKENTSKKS